jgi:hypothetical protein
MGAPDRRRVAIGLVMVVGALLLALPAPIAQAQARAAASDPVGGIDVDSAVAQLGDDHVALVGDVAQPPAAWTAVVDDARDRRLALSLVVLGTAPVGATPTDVAEAVFGQVRGTVLVLAPADAAGRTVGLASSDVGQAEVDAVQGELDGSPPTPATAGAVVDRLTDDGFPWLLVVGAALIVAIAVGVGLGLWHRHRRRRERTELHPELTEWLRARLAHTGGELLVLREAVIHTDRDDLKTRVEAVAAEREALLAAVEHGPVDRPAMDLLAGRMAAVDSEISDLRGEVDAARTA